MKEKPENSINPPVRAGSLAPESLVFTYDEAASLFNRGIELGREEMINNQLEAIKGKLLRLIDPVKKIPEYKLGKYGNPVLVSESKKLDEIALAPIDYSHEDGRCPEENVPILEFGVPLED